MYCIDSERKRYCDLTSEQLSAISVPDAVHCTNVNCSDPVPTEETTRFYIAILGSLQDASSSVFQQAVNGRGGNYPNKPGWADYVSDLYKDSRDIGKCGAMLGYLSFIANRSQDVNMPFVTSNVLKIPCVKKLLPEN